MASFFFIEKRAAENLLLTPDATSFLLLTFEPGADPATGESRLRRLPVILTRLLMGLM